MHALTGATIRVAPHDPPVTGVLVIDGATVRGIEAEVPNGAHIVDCTGCTIMPAFTNSHVHFFERKWANAASMPADELQRQLDDFLTRYGFVSVFDLSSQRENTFAIRDRIESGEIRGPRIRTTGEGLLPPGGAAPDLAYQMMGLTKTPLFEPADARAATDIVKQLLDDGVDGIKLFLSAPNGAVMSRGVIDAAIAEAHRANKPVFAHPNTAADVVTAIDAGVDVLAHTTPRYAWPDGLKPVATSITPTLWIWKFYSRHDRVALQDQWRATSLAQLRSWRAAGGRVLFGTDLGAVDPDPTEEYSLMQEAGMTFDEILASLTTSRIERGAPADIVVFRDAFADVRYVFRDGRMIYADEASFIDRSISSSRGNID